MPNWTLGDVMSKATARVGRRADLPASEVSFWANAALQEVVQSVPHALSEKTTIHSVVSGTSTLDLPSDHLETISVSLFSTDDAGSGLTLEPTTAQWADAKGYYPQGKPQKYFLYRNQLNLWPSANSSANSTVASGRSYLHRYYARQEDLVSTGSVPSIDTEWRQAWLYLTEARLFEFLGDEAMAAVAQTRYLGYVSSLKDAEARRQASSGHRAVSMPMRKSRY